MSFGFWQWNCCQVSKGCWVEFTGFTGSMDVLFDKCSQSTGGLALHAEDNRDFALSGFVRCSTCHNFPDAASSNDLHSLMRMLHPRVSWPCQVCMQVYP